MKLPLITIAAALAGTAASAHGGAHLHPHGIDLWVIALITAGVGIASFALMRR